MKLLTFGCLLAIAVAFVCSDEHEQDSKLQEKRHTFEVSRGGIGYGGGARSQVRGSTRVQYGSGQTLVAEDNKQEPKHQEKRGSYRHSHGNLGHGGEAVSHVHISTFRRGYGGHDENSLSTARIRSFGERQSPEKTVSHSEESSVPVSQSIPAQVVRNIHVPAPQTIPSSSYKSYPMEKLYSVPVDKSASNPVEKRVPYPDQPTEKKTDSRSIPIQVSKPVDVPVSKTYSTFVPQPVSDYKNVPVQSQSHGNVEIGQAFRGSYGDRIRGVNYSGGYGGSGGSYSEGHRGRESQVPVKVPVTRQEPVQAPKPVDVYISKSYSASVAQPVSDYKVYNNVPVQTQTYGNEGGGQWVGSSYGKRNHGGSYSVGYGGKGVSYNGGYGGNEGSYSGGYRGNGVNYRDGHEGSGGSYSVGYGGSGGSYSGGYLENSYSGSQGGIRGGNTGGYGGKEFQVPVKVSISHQQPVQAPKPVNIPISKPYAVSITQPILHQEPVQAPKPVDIPISKPYAVSVTQPISYYKTFPQYIQTHGSEGGQWVGSSYGNNIHGGSYSGGYGNKGSSYNGGYGGSAGSYSGGYGEKESPVPVKVPVSHLESIQTPKTADVPVSKPYPLHEPKPFYHYKNVPAYIYTHGNEYVGQGFRGSYSDGSQGEGFSGAHGGTGGGYGGGYGGSGYGTYDPGHSGGYGQGVRYISGYGGRLEGAYGSGHGGPNTVTITKEIPTPISHSYFVRWVKNVGVSEPHSVSVPVEKPYPVPENSVSYSVEKRIPYTVHVPVKVPVSHSAPVQIHKPVAYQFHVPVNVPVAHQVSFYRNVPLYVQSYGQESRGYDAANRGGYGAGYSGYQGRDSLQVQQVPWGTLHSTPPTASRHA